MVTSRDILRATGLRAGKTLTRWHQQGLIPAPEVGTHPSGRGKIAYWPDWVLETCKQIVELERQGHSPRAAQEVLRLRQYERQMNQLDRLGQSPVPDAAGRPLADVFIALVIRDYEQRSPENRARLIGAMRDAQAFQLATYMATAGYNPVALYDGTRVEVMPDFAVAHVLSLAPELALDDKPMALFPLLPALKKIFQSGVLPEKPTVRPAGRVWMDREDRTIELGVYVDGKGGVEFIPGPETVVSERADALVHAQRDPGVSGSTR